MLHRSFKPAKCKTALKLSVSRIKLLKNKGASTLLQLRREIAKLLESGQERTARIRVEHLVKEEKTIAAYDLLEVYLELIAARLAMIESQKNCPIDLKEAVTSVIFASPRFGDLPELQDIRKQLQSKYGKEFSTAAIELRPGCGVSRLMIEKLSVAAPDAQTKTKILSAIALEHKINWDPNTSGENEEKPPEDLLSGPNSFLKASQKYEEPPIQAPTINTQKHDAYTHENPSSPHISSATASTYQSQPQTPSMSRATAEEMGHRYTYSGDQNTYAAGKQHWNMEFTDATTAAHAAAEAAERASMAARAAAELSSGERILRQQSSESRRPSVNDLRNASIDKHTVPTVSNANVSKDHVIESHHGGDSRMQTDKPSTKKSQVPHSRPDVTYQNEELETSSGKSKMPPDHVSVNERKGTNRKLDSSVGSNHFSRDSTKNSHDELREQGTNANEQVNPGRQNEHLNRPVHIRGSSRSDSLKKSKASFQEEDAFINSYIQENIFSNTDQDADHENNFADEEGRGMGSSNFKSTEADDINYFADEIIHGNSNKGTSPSHSTKSEVDHNEHRTEHETAVFDSSGTDDDEDHKFDFTGGFKDDDPDPFKFLDQGSPIYESPKRSAWFASNTSFGGLASKPIFADDKSSSMKLFRNQSNIVGSSHSHESLPVAFDQSDSEVELDESDHVVSSTPERLSRHSGFSAGSGDCECVTTTFPVFDEDVDEPQHHISSHSVVSDKESKRTRESPYSSGSDTSIEQPSLDTGKELNLGLLIGGLRNKGKNNPLIIKNSTNAPSLPAYEPAVNDTSSPRSRTFAVFESSAKQRLSGLQQTVRTDKKPSPPQDDSSHSDDEPPRLTIERSQESRDRNASRISSHKSSFNSPTTYTDNTDEVQSKKGSTVQNLRSSVDTYKSSVSSRATYDEDTDILKNEETSPVQVSRPKPHLASGLSRRTKTSTPDGQRKTSTPDGQRKTSTPDGQRKTSTPDGQRKPSRETYNTTSLSVTEPDHEDQSEVPKLSRPIPRKSAHEAKRRPIQNKPSSSTQQLEYFSNVSVTSTKDTASSSTPKTEHASTRQDSIKKASHVHPKLPDFDTLAAHFSSLRTDGK